MLKFIDLFCGIGAFHQALHQLGAKCVFSCEINPQARKTYIANHQSKMPALNNDFPEDITKINPDDILDFDILCAGFPCQPFSQAGIKKGFEDSRGNLFFDIMKIVDAKRPKVLFLENVRHLVNHDNGKTFKTIQEQIVKRGYSFDWKIIKASDHGLPQHRPRVFIVCFDKNTVPNYQSFSFPQPIPLKMTMSDVFGGVAEREIGFTLRVGGRSSPVDDRRNWDGYIVDGKLRRVSSREGKIMMGFAQSFTFPVSETQAMKQLGNSIAIPVAHAVGKNIIKTLKD